VILRILFQDKALHRLLVKNMVAQDVQKVFNGKMMVPNSLRMHIGQGLPGAFSEARATNANGFANHVIAIHRVQKPRSEFIQKEFREAVPVAARPGAD
jgi:hypothetical protein